MDSKSNFMDGTNVASKKDSVNSDILKDSKNADVTFVTSKEKLVNLDSKDSIESKSQNSQLQDLCQSIPTRPPFFKINTNPATANFANHVDENIESKKEDSTKLENTESRFYKNIKTTNLDSKNSNVVFTPPPPRIAA